MKGNFGRRLSVFAVTALICSSAQAVQGLNSRVYGYLEGYVEKVEKQPTRSGGNGSTTAGSIERVKNAHEFDTPNIVLMVKSDYKGKYSGFLNLRSGGDSVTTQNAWVENRLYKDWIKFRMGKLYRPFGLYNERLDAVPTYIGIEPPELFDNDHLLLTRTTNMMLHGEFDIKGDKLNWALTTGNDERFGSEVPVGGDVRYAHYWNNNEFLFGTSFYFSNHAKYNSGNVGGVERWMIRDNFNVWGLFGEFTNRRWKVQGAYYNASHEATRDGSIINGSASSGAWTDDLRGTLNSRQLQQFCQGNCATAGNSEADYDVTTWYLRAGYSFYDGDWGQITPYIQWDFYENPETIENKGFGGDKEAGLADDGKFTKQTAGVVLRPVPVTAFKFDISNHSQKIDGDNTNYMEGRFSFSYIWSL